MRVDGRDVTGSFHPGQDGLIGLVTGLDVGVHALTATRLHAIFPGGVCDWSRPGVGQQPPAGTWLSFGPP